MVFKSCFKKFYFFITSSRFTLNSVPIASINFRSNEKGEPYEILTFQKSLKYLKIPDKCSENKIKLCNSNMKSVIFYETKCLKTVETEKKILF